MPEAEVCAGSQMSLVTRHDTYGISFAWPTATSSMSTSAVSCSHDATNLESSSFDRSTLDRDGYNHISVGPDWMPDSSVDQTSRGHNLDHSSRPNLDHSSSTSAEHAASRGSTGSSAVDSETIHSGCISNSVDANTGVADGQDSPSKCCSGSKSSFGQTERVALKVKLLSWCHACLSV